MKERIILFLEAKNDLINERTGEECPSYLIEEDIEEIRGWSDEECEQIHWRLYRAIKSGVLKDMETCPWCIRQSFYFQSMDFYDNGCPSCGYAKRHGKCTDDFSTYDLITREITISLIINDYKEHLLSKL